MTERKIEGSFLGVPILSKGSYTEEERLRRDGFGYAILSLYTYEARDHITSAILLLLTLFIIVNITIFQKTSLYFRLTLSLVSSVTWCAAILRSDIVGLLPAMVVAIFAYYGLMYFAHFDR